MGFDDGIAIHCLFTVMLLIGGGRGDHEVCDVGVQEETHGAKEVGASAEARRGKGAAERRDQDGHERVCSMLTAVVGGGV